MGYLINNGLATFEGGMMPMILIIGVMQPFMAAAISLKDLTTANKAARRFFEATGRVSAVDPTSTDGLSPASTKGEIEVKAVRFAYPSATEHYVCKGYSLTIAAGPIRLPELR